MYVSTYLLCENGVEGVDKQFFFAAAATSHARSDLAAPVHPERPRVLDEREIDQNCSG